MGWTEIKAPLSCPVIASNEPLLFSNRPPKHLLERIPTRPELGFFVDALELISKRGLKYRPCRRTLVDLTTLLAEEERNLRRFFLGDPRLWLKPLGWELNC